MMVNELDDGIRLLTPEEAASLLQPHMQGKDAVAWLAHDRKYDPVVPYVVAGGTPFYRDTDLIAFITRVIRPSARFIHVGVHHIPERRASTDRRTESDRRKNPEHALHPGIERRLSRLDRRLRGGIDRRAHRASPAERAEGS